MDSIICLELLKEIWLLIETFILRPKHTRESQHADFPAPSGKGHGIFGMKITLNLEHISVGHAHMVSALPTGFLGRA